MRHPKDKTIEKIRVFIYNNRKCGDEMEYAIIGLLVAVVALIIAIVSIASKSGGFTIEPPHRAAGRRGEHLATMRIKSVLRADDALFNNVSISYDGKPAELDNVIVNKYGVFIIEVKNYSGRLSGFEDDYEWTKVHISDAGNPYVKTVKNPIKQVKRETHILAKYLEYYGVSVWVDGYAMILGASSPVDSKYMLTSVADIDLAIHTSTKRKLTPNAVQSIINLLKDS